MQIKSYDTVDDLTFGASQLDDAVSVYGEPLSSRVNRGGHHEMWYDQFALRFDQQDHTLRECTLIPYKEALINGIGITWDQAFLKAATDADGSPVELLGSIVLLKLGIMISGIHDADTSQLAVTAFRKGDVDHLLKHGTPFEL